MYHKNLSRILYEIDVQKYLNVSNYLSRLNNTPIINHENGANHILYERTVKSGFLRGRKFRPTISENLGTIQ